MELLALVNARLATLDREIQELRPLRDQIECYQSQLASCQPDEHLSFRVCPDVPSVASTSERSHAEEEHPIHLAFDETLEPYPCGCGCCGSS